MRLKYIMTFAPIIFKDNISHKDAANGLTVTSAGFCNIDYDIQKQRFIAQVFGKSTSLGIKSEPEKDKMEIENMLNEYCLSEF